MMVRLNILLGEVLAFSDLAFGSPSPGAEPRVYEIEIDKLAFGLAPEVLHMNDIVEWVNADIFQHTATATEGSFDVDLPAGPGPDDFETGGGRGLFLSFPSGQAGTAGAGPLPASEDS
jgi:plastocyanin